MASRSNTDDTFFIVETLSQGWRTFFDERAKILKIKFSKLKPCHYSKQTKNINEFDADVKDLFLGLHPISVGKQ